MRIEKGMREVPIVSLSDCWPTSGPNHARILEIDYMIFLVCVTSRTLISTVRCKLPLHPLFLVGFKNRNKCLYSFGTVLLRVKHKPAETKGDG